jgi:hypothetical protein
MKYILFVIVSAGSIFYLLRISDIFLILLDSGISGKVRKLRAYYQAKARNTKTGLTHDLGDALVTAASAKIPGSSHHDFPDNHVRAAYDRKVHAIILDFLR